MPLPATVSPLELLWTLITATGCVLASFNCWDAYGDVRILESSGRNGILKVSATGELLDQQMILLALGCDCVLGTLAMFALPGREADGDPSLSSILAPWLMITGALALIYLSFSKKRRRKKIASALRGQQDIDIERRHAELTNSLTALHGELNANTTMTEHAAERADAAYQEANHVNHKIEETNKAGRVATDAGNEIMGRLDITGTDTNQRVRKVEDAVVQTDAAAELTDKRLDKLEASNREEVVEVHVTQRRMVETGEDTNQRVRNVEEAMAAAEDAAEDAAK